LQKILPQKMAVRFSLGKAIKPRTFTGECVDKTGGKSVCIVNSKVVSGKNGKSWCFFTPFDTTIPTIEKSLRSGSEMRNATRRGKFAFECF
jgi:hypothetical protein